MKDETLKEEVAARRQFGAAALTGLLSVTRQGDLDVPELAKDVWRIADAVLAEEMPSLDYIMPFGRFKGRPLKDLDVGYLEEMLTWIENKKLTEKHAATYGNIKAYLRLKAAPEVAEEE